MHASWESEEIESRALVEGLTLNRVKDNTSTWMGGEEEWMGANAIRLSGWEMEVCPSDSSYFSCLGSKFTWA